MIIFARSAEKEYTLSMYELDGCSLAKEEVGNLMFHKLA